MLRLPSRDRLRCPMPRKNHPIKATETIPTGRASTFLLYVIQTAHCQVAVPANSTGPGVLRGRTVGWRPNTRHSANRPDSRHQRMTVFPPATELGRRRRCSRYHDTHLSPADFGQGPPLDDIRVSELASASPYVGRTDMRPAPKARIDGHWHLGCEVV